MRVVIQRVKNAVLSVDGKTVSQIEHGLVVYFCVEKGDNDEFCNVFAKKVSNLRIFSDQNGKMNLSVKDVGGEILFVSQFTLSADLSCGNRPYFAGAEEPVRANELYLQTAKLICQQGVVVKTGVFGADMQIVQANDGPVTILWESQK